MQMIEVRVRYQDQINRWQIAYSQSGTPQALEHEKPASKVGINDHILPAHLDKKAGMADEGYAQFSVRDKLRFMGLSTTGGHHRMAYQTSELGRPFAQSRIAKSNFNHPLQSLVGTEMKSQF
jgi:hypothetical protein